MFEESYFGLEKKRYETRGINERLPIQIKLVIWNLIDGLEEVRKDYLQVFRLEVVSENGRKVQQIVHSQEEPEYSNTYTIPLVGDGVKGKVFCIDDGADYVTMLWAEEY